MFLAAVTHKLILRYTKEWISRRPWRWESWRKRSEELAWEKRFFVSSTATDCFSLWRRVSYLEFAYLEFASWLGKFLYGTKMSVRKLMNLHRPFDGVLVFVFVECLLDSTRAIDPRKLGSDFDFRGEPFSQKNIERFLEATTMRLSQLTAATLLLSSAYGTSIKY